MRLGKSEVQRITTQYYEHFCCTNLSKLACGTHFICSAERDRILKGYGCKYSLFILKKDHMCVVSYAPAYKDFMEALKQNHADQIIAAVEEKYNLQKRHLMIFEEETVLQYGHAKILGASDYSSYEAFFRATNQSANPDGWLQEYFLEKASKGYFTGYFEDDCLVSVCDAPDMPYMEKEIQHTGIVTLEEKRRKGYGKLTAALSTHHLLEIGVCPQWECDIRNIASFELAKSIGYKAFGTAYIVEE